MRHTLVFALLMVSLGGGAHAAEVKEEAGKDLCLLDINNCAGRSYYTIVEKLARIRAALDLGTKIYTPQEVEHLRYLLDEALEVAERIDAHPSQVPENRDK